MTNESSQLSLITQKVLNSTKYKYIYPLTVDRIVLDIYHKYGLKNTEKKVRDLLHQVWGAYWKSPPKYSKLMDSFIQNKNLGKSEKECLLPLLTTQSSTKERIPFLDEFYQQIFAVTGIPKSLIELACGFNPLTYPWMNLPSTSSYTAYDIDLEEIKFINEISTILNYSDQVSCSPGDILLGNIPEAEVILLLKTLPILEHQRKGSSKEILQSLKCKYLVVSFPTQSITGFNKGMSKFYTEQFEKMMSDMNMQYKKLMFTTEIVYILEKDLPI